MFIHINIRNLYLNNEVVTQCHCDITLESMTQSSDIPFAGGIVFPLTGIDLNEDLILLFKQDGRPLVRMNFLLDNLLNASEQNPEIVPYGENEDGSPMDFALEMEMRINKDAERVSQGSDQELSMQQTTKGDMESNNNLLYENSLKDKSWEGSMAAEKRITIQNDEHLSEGTLIKPDDSHRTSSMNEEANHKEGSYYPSKVEEYVEESRVLEEIKAPTANQSKTIEVIETSQVIEEVKERSLNGTSGTGSRNGKDSRDGGNGSRSSGESSRKVITTVENGTSRSHKTKGGELGGDDQTKNPEENYVIEQSEVLEQYEEKKSSSQNIVIETSEVIDVYEEKSINNNIGYNNNNNTNHITQEVVDQSEVIEEIKEKANESHNDTLQQPLDKTKSITTITTNINNNPSNSNNNNNNPNNNNINPNASGSIMSGYYQNNNNISQNQTYSIDNNRKENSSLCYRKESPGQDVISRTSMTEQQQQLQQKSNTNQHKSGSGSGGSSGIKARPQKEIENVLNIFEENIQGLSVSEEKLTQVKGWIDYIKLILTRNEDEANSKSLSKSRTTSHEEVNRSKSEMYMMTNPNGSGNPTLVQNTHVSLVQKSAEVSGKIQESNNAQGYNKMEDYTHPIDLDNLIKKDSLTGHLHKPSSVTFDPTKDYERNILEKVEQEAQSIIKSIKERSLTGGLGGSLGGGISSWTENKSENKLEATFRQDSFVNRYNTSGMVRSIVEYGGSGSAAAGQQQYILTQQMYNLPLSGSNNHFSHSIQTDRYSQDCIIENTTTLGMSNAKKTYMININDVLNKRIVNSVNDKMTKDIILQMSKHKNKMSYLILDKSIAIDDKKEIQIWNKSYFNDNCNKRYLHYLMPNTKNLYLYNISKRSTFDTEHNKVKFEKIELKIEYNISSNVKSLITPAGLIFAISANESDQLGKLYLYNDREGTLLEKSGMNNKRRISCGFTYLGKCLFAIGGICQDKLTSTCEKYDIRSNEWITIAPMNKALRDCSVCKFGDRYVFRFFGINSYNTIDDTIERYDMSKNKWVLMNIQGLSNYNDIYSFMCCQVNEDHIFIFGGKNINGFPPSKSRSFLLKVDERRGSYHHNAEIISIKKSFLMNYAGSFSSNSLIVDNGKIIFMREDYDIKNLQA